MKKESFGRDVLSAKGSSSYKFTKENTRSQFNDDITHVLKKYPKPDWWVEHNFDKDLVSSPIGPKLPLTVGYHGFAPSKIEFIKKNGLVPKSLSSSGSPAVYFSTNKDSAVHFKDSYIVTVNLRGLEKDIVPPWATEDPDTTTDGYAIAIGTSIPHSRILKWEKISEGAIEK